MFQKTLMQRAAMSAAILFITGCGNSSQNPELGVRTFEYTCGKLGAAVLKLAGNDNAMLHMGKEERGLTPAISASGAKYTGEGVVFWTKGREAILSLGEQDYRCVEIAEGMQP